MQQPSELLSKQGFFLTNLLYPSNIIEEWNTLLNSTFSARLNEDRAYVQANELFELSILDKIFNNKLKSLLCHLMPQALFYHCHAYEIKAYQSESHIHWGTNFGWHRDEECGLYYNSNQANHISMFIYLTDVVNEANGPFEIRLKSPLSYLQLKEKTFKVLGKAGTVFFFNRFFLHRACPNYSSLRRRVIKFSFQPRIFDNNRINLKEFVELRQLVSGKNDFLEYLVSPDHPASSLLEIMGKSSSKSYPKAVVPPLNSVMEVGLKYVAKYNFRLLKEKFARTESVAIEQY